VLFAVLEQEAPLTTTERDIILSAIEQGMAEAGARFMDVTPKANEARLREAQEILHLALESAQMGTWHIDLKTNRATSSPGLVAILGIPEAPENIFELIARLMHPEDLEEVNRVWQEAVATHAPYQHEYRIIRPDGSIRWILSRGTTKLGPDGEPAYFSGVAADVTDRKRAEEELAKARSRAEEAEKRFELATSFSRVGIWEFDIQRQTVWRSFSHDALFGYREPVKDWTPETFLRHVHPDDREDVARALEHMQREPGPYCWEFRAMRADGSTGWLEINGHTVTDASGTPSKMLGAILDITDRKLADAQAEAARKELREVFMQAPTPLVVMSGPEHRFTLANPPFEKLVNREVLGRTLREAFTEEGAVHTLPIIDKVYRTGEPHVWKELPIALPDEKGAIRQHYLNVSYTALRDSKGHISAVTGLVLDVTEQVQARQEVSRVLDTVPQIVWIANAQGEIQFLSRQWMEYTGIDSSTGGLGKQFEEAMHPDDILANVRAVQDARGRRGPVTLVHRLKAPGGEYRWVLARGNPTFSDSGEFTGWIGVTIDIHEHRLAQEELSRAVERLQEERELRERFVATLSHDLRNPLTAAKMGTQLLMRRGADPVVLTRTVGRIAENIDRADRMIQDLLDANRLRVGETLPLEITGCDLGAIAKETLEELAQVHGDRFVLRAPESLHGYWSSSDLRRVIENLCNNAVKYGARERPVTVTVTQPEPEQVLLSVHNWGTPIPAEDQVTLFEPYRRTKSAQTGEQRGWGLGLTLVKGLVEAQHGTVKVESTETSGTTFSVILPLDVRSRPN
jgi:PAS domain S-box-containing protein